MNWSEIKESCPKAFELLLGYKSFNWRSVRSDWEKITINYYRANQRCLYEFFDAQDVIIGLHVNSNGSLTPLIAAHLPGVGGRTHVVDILREDYSREESELAAFIKAFELLEKKLS